jgi:hypothetical protein
VKRKLPAAVDLAAHGFPQTEAEAKRRGYDWKSVKKALDAQHEVAECRRRAARNRDLLDMRLD